jgi:cell division protein FtsL
MVTVQVLTAVLLVCLGVLLGTSWTTQLLESTLRRRAEERRRLNQEWLAVREARQRWTKCPRCGMRLTDRDRS